ncbi:MAG TPA: thiol:disulfide interchange protein DsbA/DsbL [Pseudomonadales bacterium]
MNLALVRGVLACLLLSLAAAAHAQQRYIEGVHYQRIAEPAAAQALGAANTGKSVVEVFWYGCGHCYAFEPLLNGWVARKGGSIAFARSPMVWDETTKQHARLFHATQALGLHADMHARVFEAIHEERNYLLDDRSLAALFAEFGVDAQTHATSAGSFGVDAALRRTEAAQRELAIPSVPALIVNGTWMINTTREVPTHQAMLDVADYLLEQKP